MNISSVVLHTHPQHQSLLMSRLGEVPGLEVHGSNPDGRLALTLESASTDAAMTTFAQLNGFEGVLSVALIYQYSDDDIDSQEAEK